MTSPTLTLKTDIIIAICQPHLDHIVSLKKNHEFRRYLLPACVKRFWIYEPSPVSAVRYIAEVSNGKRPGEVKDESFIRNADFNKGIIEHGEFAYEIITLEELESPVTLADLKSRNWLGGAPQKYCYLKKSMAHGMRDAKTIAISAHLPSILSAVSPEWEQEGSDIETTSKLAALYYLLYLNGYNRLVLFSFEAVNYEEAADHIVRRHSQRRAKDRC
jgi:hypothetical protein